MKKKIIEIIGFGMEPERAEIMAREIIILFNTRVVEKTKEGSSSDLLKVIDNIYISEEE